jgi:hypothetical protein
VIVPSPNHIYGRIESGDRQGVDTDHFYLKVITTKYIRSKNSDGNNRATNKGIYGKTRDRCIITRVDL